MNRESYFRELYGIRNPHHDRILRESLIANDLPPMQIGEDTARFLGVLVRIIRPRLVVELGSFVGYSAIHIGQNLPVGSRLISAESDAALAALARDNVKAAGLSERVDILAADAISVLSKLDSESVDLLFIDADKLSYPDYLKAGARVIRSGGLLVADDCYPDGDFGREESVTGTARQAIDVFNLAIARSHHFTSVLIGTGQGIMVALKEDRRDG